MCTCMEKSTPRGEDTNTPLQRRAQILERKTQKRKVFGFWSAHKVELLILGTLRSMINRWVVLSEVIGMIVGTTVPVDL